MQNNVTSLKVEQAFAVNLAQCFVRVSVGIVASAGALVVKGLKNCLVLGSFVVIEQNELLFRFSFLCNLTFFC